MQYNQPISDKTWQDNQYTSELWSIMSQMSYYVYDILVFDLLVLSDFG